MPGRVGELKLGMGSANFIWSLSYRKTPRLSILVVGNFLGGRAEMLTFELS